MASRKKRPKRITIDLPGNLADALTKAVDQIHTRNRRSKVSEADLVLDALKKAFGASKLKRSSFTRETLIEQAGVAKAKAVAAMMKGDARKARSFYLLAVVKEVEALMTFDLDGGDASTESAVRTALIEVVGCLKSGTGYRALPDVPVKRGAPKSTVV